MYINSLKLENYRNYSSLNINFAKNFNIIYGNNGQGKTNILEAIFLCSSGRSHRTSKDNDLIRLLEKRSYIKIDFKRMDSESTIEILLNKAEKKKIKINEIPLKKVGNLIGHLNTVVFSPEDLMIIKEGPSERRRFIDITLSQLRPSYFFDLQQYSRILSQRNTLLKEIVTKSSLIDTLDVWNNNLAAIGSRIMKVRNEFIKRIGEISEKNHNMLTSGTEKLTLKYSPSVKAESYQSIDQVKNDFLKRLENNINRELAKCMTLYGPHRDDYEIFINDESLKLYGSQGQQRTSILSIKLSEIEIMKEETGEYPVLLLDDVMSELDSSRQEYLLNSLRNIQTFITCTDKSFFTNKVSPDTLFCEISKGEIMTN